MFAQHLHSTHTLQLLRPRARFCCEWQQTFFLNIPRWHSGKFEHCSKDLCNILIIGKSPTVQRVKGALLSAANASNPPSLSVSPTTEICGEKSTLRCSHIDVMQTGIISPLSALNEADFMQNETFTIMTMRVGKSKGIFIRPHSYKVLQKPEVNIIKFKGSLKCKRPETWRGRGNIWFGNLSRPQWS